TPPPSTLDPVSVMPTAIAVSSLTNSRGGSYILEGCYQSPGYPFDGPVGDFTDLTPESCADACSGYAFFGVEKDNKLSTAAVVPSLREYRGVWICVIQHVEGIRPKSADPLHTF
ncbi:MAG: hypothetical protein Q9187_003106, partial [Circinaria calcarea]